MNRKYAIVFAIWGSTLLAYGKGQSAPFPKVTSASAAAASEAAEEIEILGRLLDRAVAASFGLRSTGTTAVLVPSGGQHPPSDRQYAPATIPGGHLFWGPTGQQTAAWTDNRGPQPGKAEGTYLKGHGVVYALTLHTAANVVLREPEKVVSQPLSAWEQARRELRGERSATPAEAPRSQGLREALLRALAENGRHLSGLGVNEQVTVLVTLRPTAGVAVAVAPLASTPALFRALSQGGGPASPGAAATPAATPQARSVDRSEVHNQMLLGDLHLKQNRFREALEAYEKAVAEHARVYRDRPDDVSLRLETAEMLTKLAQAYLAAGEATKAQAMLEKLAKLAEGTGKSEKTPRTGRGPALPGKLVVSVSKALLDSYASGKVDFEEFRRQATVQFTPPTGGEAVSVTPVTPVAPVAPVAPLPRPAGSR